MRKFFAMALAGFLVGCAGVPAAPPPTIQTVRVPIAVACVKSRPAAPILPAVPKAGIFDQAKALVARDKIRASYEGELNAVIDACDAAGRRSP
jgi:hypothetical protein